MEKNFKLTCPKCRFARMSTGLADDLKDLKEINTCASCGGGRKYRCPKCGAIAKLARVRGNNS